MTTVKVITKAIKVFQKEKPNGDIRSIKLLEGTGNGAISYYLVTGKEE